MGVLSIVIPCYNEELTIPLFYREILQIVDRLQTELELIFVDDGSSDRTLAVIKELAAADHRIKYMSFSRNFGKEAAVYAGLKWASGKFTAVMDADLQDPPSMLPDMLRAVREEGYDSAAARRADRRGEPPIRSFFAHGFYRIFAHMSTVELMDGARDYRVMTRQFTDAVLNLGEYNRFSKGLFGWVGFQTKWFDYKNTDRVAGTSKWSFWKLFLYSVEGIVSFSTAPLTAALALGIIFGMVSLGGFLVCGYRAMAFHSSMWPAAFWGILLVSGLQLFCIGIVGIYLAKSYMEIKGRPIFLCRESNMKETGND